MRTFYDCWQEHEKIMDRDALRLKQGNVGDADTLCAHAYDKGERAWPGFDHKGELKYEIGWLKKIMWHCHISDGREMWRKSESGDAPRADGSGSRWETIQDTGPVQGSDRYLHQYCLEESVTAVLNLLITDPGALDLTQDDVDIFIKHRLNDRSLEAIATERGMPPHEVLEAIAKVDAVFRDLFVMLVSEDPDFEDEEAIVAFDDCFDTVIDDIEEEILSGQLTGVTLRNVLIFRRYYAHHEPNQTEVAEHFGLGNAAAVSFHLKKVRSIFCFHWKNACLTVRSALQEKWERLSKWKASFLDRWKSLQPMNSASIGQELESTGLSPKQSKAEANPEFLAVQQERKQLQFRRKVHEEKYGAQSLTHHEPTEMFTRRERVALICDGVAVPAGPGRPA